MVKFINLETGYIFDGSKPYVFWFENGQSTELIYSKSIGIFSDSETLDISIEDNDIFSLINPNLLNTEEVVNGFNYHSLDTIKTTSYTSQGTSHDTGYIHVIYFTASSKIAGEYIGEFYIGNDVYNIGADFYEENENLYINLSNFGLEIPESIQKTIYEANVHEDKRDNILINRKFKELLINYWDIIANRGSYKSLINSINWFEWGDILKLREVWKKDNGIKTIFDTRELSSMMSDKYIDTLSNYAKTTYYALYVPKESVTDEYDTELNPVTIDNSSQWKWPVVDIMIKMSLLGHFYETYFMPIHLDLIHSTIEDVVFTNTIKTNNGALVDRFDNVYDFESVNCNLMGNEEFLLNNVSCQVNKFTQMSTQWNGEEDYDDIYIIGVDDVVDTVTENDIKTFYSQIYNGPGVLVPIELSFKLNSNDFIKSEKVTYVHDRKEDWNTFELNRIYRASRDGKVHIDFKLLCTKEQQYDIRLQFESASGRVLTKRLLFNVYDRFNPSISVFKIKSIDNPQYELLLNDSPIFNAIMIEKDDWNTDVILPDKFKYSQYIQSSQNGIKLNHMIIAKNNNSEQIKQYLETYYFVMNLGKKIDNVDTTIYISKDYVGSNDLITKTDLMGIKYTHNKYIFIPQFHELVEFGGESLEDYTIYDETLCCIPNIRMSHKINDWVWTFENASTNKVITLPPVQEPIIASNQDLISNGFYNIIFKYSLNDGNTRELKLNSAFIKK